MSTVIVDGVLFETSEDIKNKILLLLTDNTPTDNASALEIETNNDPFTDTKPVTESVDADAIIKESIRERPKAYTSSESRKEAERRLQKLNEKFNKKGDESWLKDF